MEKWKQTCLTSFNKSVAGAINKSIFSVLNAFEIQLMYALLSSVLQHILKHRTGNFILFLVSRNTHDDNNNFKATYLSQIFHPFSSSPKWPLFLVRRLWSVLFAESQLESQHFVIRHYMNASLQVCLEVLPH